MMKNMENANQTTYWNEHAEAKLADDQAANIREIPSHKTGTRRSSYEKHKLSIYKGQQRGKEARERDKKARSRYHEFEVPNDGKLRHHQLSRTKSPDNFHNVRVEKVAKAELANYANIEVEVFNPATA